MLKGITHMLVQMAILRVSSPAILRSILEPIPTGIFIIPVGIANYPHL